MSIYNQIFDTYRIEQKKIEEAIKLLEKNNYRVINKNK
jgi:hypothetical protein